MSPDPHDRHPADVAPTPHRRVADMLRRYLRLLGPNARADLDDELEFHLAMRTREYVARGMTEEEARAAARTRLGDVERIRAACAAFDAPRARRRRRSQWLDALRQDVRFAVRTLLREKGWTAVGVLTLAIGIGANTAVFSVINGLLLHPLPYPHADRMVFVYQDFTGAGGQVGDVQVRVLPNAPTFRAWRAGAHAFEDLQAYTTDELVLTPRTGAATVVHGAGVLPGFASFVGAHALLGRSFTATDVATHAKVALVSEGMWRTRYGAGRNVLGRTLALNGTVYTIVGVMPASFQLPRLVAGAADVFTPLELGSDQLGVSVIGRLRPGVSTGTAVRELQAIANHAKTQLGSVTEVLPPRQMVRNRSALLAIAAAVTLVLLIACANIAHLLLARGVNRRREMAVRTALGAGRARLARQLITESLVLAAAGCLAGVALAWAGLRVLVAFRPAALSTLDAARLDGATLLVAVALSGVTGLVFGVVGAVQSARRAPSEVLKSGALGASEGRSHVRGRALLVISEMALCSMLLVDAALLIQGVMALQHADLGFAPRGLYTMTGHFAASSRTTSADRWTFFEDVAARAGRLPGVAAITVSSFHPPEGEYTIGPLDAEGRPPPSPDASNLVRTVRIHRDFFHVVRMRLLEGAIFSDTTEAGAQVIINAGLARHLWPGASAVGHRIRIGMGSDVPWRTIVGVVSDAAFGGARSDPSQATFYLPISRAPVSRQFPPVIVARLDRPAVAIPALRALVERMDPALPPPNVSSVSNTMAATLARPRFTMLLLAVFAGLALALAAVGLYGVVAYAVAQRTREIGIRLAIGATPRGVARSVLTRGLVLGAVGLGLGFVGAHWGRRLIAGSLESAAPSNLLSYVVAAVVLLAATAVASVVPMRRAMRVSAVAAMRAD